MKVTVLKWIFLAVCIAALFFFGCPFYNLFHVQCPVCGVTRAWLSALGGDFNQAFSYHLFFPLIPFVIPAFFLLDLKHFPYHKALKTGLIVFAAVLTVYNLLRGLNFV